MKAYIASPFFNDRQRDDVSRVEKACELAYWNYYSPRMGKISEVYNKLNEDDPNDRSYLNLYKKMVFMEDVIEIDTSDVVFINYNGKDSGTLFELGYALAKRKKIICSCTDKEEEIEFNSFLKNVKKVIADYDINNNFIICKSNSLNVSIHDMNHDTIVVIAEHDGEYYGLSKVILGYLYAYSELHKEIDVVYVDVPRKSNLMLTGSSKVYECKNLNIFDDLGRDQYTNIMLHDTLHKSCTLIGDGKDE